MSTIEHIEGQAIPIPGNDIDTDRIVPARFLKEITFDQMGDYLFYDVRYDESGQTLDHPLNETRYNDASVMLVGKNFGCGSSREHAPQSILRAGFKAIIGESFAEIFAGNCKSLGIPTIILSQDEIQTLSQWVEDDPQLQIRINLDSKTITANETVMGFDIPETRRQAFMKGYWDALAMLKANDAAISEKDQSLPY